VIHGGHRLVVEADYAELSAWVSQNVARAEAKQVKIADKSDRYITFSSAHVVAVIGERGD
jgi:hypothetical protein